MPKKKEIVITEDQYKVEAENNERKFLEMLKVARPDLFVLDDILRQTGINFFVLAKILHALSNIAISGWGDVRIEIRGGRVLFIRGEETMRLDEPLVNTKLPS